MLPCAENMKWKRKYPQLLSPRAIALIQDSHLSRRHIDKLWKIFKACEPDEANTVKKSKVALYFRFTNTEVFEEIFSCTGSAF